MVDAERIRRDDQCFVRDFFASESLVFRLAGMIDFEIGLHHASMGRVEGT